ncbi:glutamate synthase-related protein, partial [Candidatus Neomarinimicrobiota bacterium]
VSIRIAAVRNSTPGVPLISPPPHHDIYSIEDLAQLIFDLKQVNPRALVSVKLVSQAGVGTIAAGVVKGGADIVLISGGDGGTGAAPLGSLKHAGLPWEFGLAETHQVLVANNLRDRMILRVDGGLRTGEDVIKAAILGAEEYDFGTALLVSLGCIMARQCHLNTCPAGIATQNPDLMRRFKGHPGDIINYLTSVAEEVRAALASLGAYSMHDIIGRTNLLGIDPRFATYATEKNMDLLPLLNQAAENGLPLAGRGKVKRAVNSTNPTIDEKVLLNHRPEIMNHGQIVVHETVSNTNRAVGARLSGELAFLYGKGNYSGNIQLRLSGVAGQSFGAFLTDGVELRLRGAANDYLGKGMAGGLVTVRFEKSIRERHEAQTIIGNVALFGATGGTALISGRAGERFAVRNSGAVAVVEGVGNHCCEYMTRGTVIVLGPIGLNFGAGMSGGTAYIHCSDAKQLAHLNNEFVRPTELSDSDELLVLRLIRQHHFHTGSVIAEDLIANWADKKSQMVRIVPLALDVLDYEDIYNQRIATRLGELLNE